MGSPTAFYIGAIYSGSYSRLLFIRFLRNFTSFIAHPEATLRSTARSWEVFGLYYEEGEVSVKFIRNTFIQTTYVGNGVFLGSTLCIWIGITMKVRDVLFSHRLVISRK